MEDFISEEHKIYRNKLRGPLCMADDEGEWRIDCCGSGLEDLKHGGKILQMTPS